MDDASSASRAWIVGVGLVLMLAAFSVPAQASQLATHNGPCVQVSLDPPGAGAGCTGGQVANSALSNSGPFSSSSSTEAFGVEAVRSGVSVDVNWSYTTHANLSKFNVYRGPHPDFMHKIGETDHATMEFTDDMAVLSGESLWYAVGAVEGDGDEVVSQPVLVQSNQPS